MSAHYQMQEIISPVSVTVHCSCGWSHKETRRQNARARKAKLDAAMRKHAAEALARSEP